jgi:hypothetical protein
MDTSGISITGRVKRISKKPATDKQGQPYEKYSFEIAYYPDSSTDPDDVQRTWVTTPPRHPMPELVVGRFYTFPISVGVIGDGDLFFRLRTNMDILPHE